MKFPYIKRFKEYKLYESPDNIRLQYKDKIGKSSDYDYLLNFYKGEVAKPIGWYSLNNEDLVWVGDWNDGHNTSPIKLNHSTKGRLWYASKLDPRLPNVLSLWYPNAFDTKELKKRVEELEEELGHSLKDWYFEKYDRTSEEEYLESAKLVPLYDYIDKGEKEKEEGDFGSEMLWHLMKQGDPRRKGRNVPQGFGSKKMKRFKEWQKPYESKNDI